MATLVQEIINKYQGSAPQRIISAVEKAAQRTGADFSLLMEKAAAESGFNAAAKSATSSATGLFQFIDSTWLTMVKEYGPKYGLGAYANQIEMKNGKPCVENCNVKQAILNLRKNPEISALMAGEMTADNKEYLEAHTDGTVGKTEMYLAHFLGAGGAAKFLNTRDDNGSMTAAAAFPREAKANRSIFYDKSGHARTLDQVYNIFSRKIGDTTQIAQNNTQNTTNGTTAGSPSARSVTTTPAPSAPSLVPSSSMPPMQSIVAQASLSSTQIFWHDAGTARSHSGFSSSSSAGSLFPNQRLSAENMMLLAHMQDNVTRNGLRDREKDDQPHYNA